MEEPRTSNTPPHSGDAHHVLADSSLTDERIRVLKNGDTFALFDQYGDIRPGLKGEAGLYHDGTRFVSRFLLEFEGARPFLLSSTVRDDNDQLSVALTNPDLSREGRVYMPMGSLHLAWRKFLWMGTLYQELCVENHGMQPVEATIGMQFAADFPCDVRKLKHSHGHIAHGDRCVQLFTFADAGNEVGEVRVGHRVRADKISG